MNKDFVCSSYHDGIEKNTKRAIFSAKLTDQRWLIGTEITKIVYICSSLKGDAEKNIRKANDYCRFAIGQGVIPIAPHVMFTGFLNDDVPEERKIGMRLGVELIKICFELWAFGDRISQGMAAEISIAKELNIPIKYFDEKCERRHHADQY